jgi:Mn-dependent DtxR family transcriptional regulator
MTQKIDASRIEQFLRAKVEMEQLSDREMALVLQVSPSTVTHWRHKFHIQPADKFTRKFQEKYGPDALECLDRMRSQHATLRAIARHFGFSPEYARQVSNKLYPDSSRAHRRKRTVREQ